MKQKKMSKQWEQDAKEMFDNDLSKNWSNDDQYSYDNSEGFWFDICMSMIVFVLCVGIPFFIFGAVVGFALGKIFL
jgi:hypothetical protein